MSLSTLFLALFLILFGINALGWVAVTGFVIGLVAFIAGILILVEAAHPITVYRRPN